MWVYIGENSRLSFFQEGMVVGDFMLVTSYNSWSFYVNPPSTIADLFLSPNPIISPVLKSHQHDHYSNWYSFFGISSTSVSPSRSLPSTFIPAEP